jgi:hypothetical protein
MRWFVNADDAEYGPLTVEGIRELLLHDVVTLDSPARRSDESEWRPLRDHAERGLAPAPTPAGSLPARSDSLPPAALAPRQPSASAPWIAVVAALGLGLGASYALFRVDPPPAAAPSAPSTTLPDPEPRVAILDEVLVEGRISGSLPARPPRSAAQIGVARRSTAR